MKPRKTESTPLRITLWLCRLAAAAILGQTLFFKFTGAPESVYIFETVGLGTAGRIGSGVAELIAVILLLIPARSTAALGGLLAVGVMAGAIGAHLTRLGIEVQGDGGLLFALAMIVFALGLTVLVAYRRSLPVVGTRIP